MHICNFLFFKKNNFKTRFFLLQLSLRKMDVKDIIKWLLSQKSPEKPSKTIVMLILAVNIVVCQAHSSTNTTDRSIANSNMNNLSNSAINRTDFAKVSKNDHELVKHRIKSLMFTTTKYIKDYLKNTDTKGKNFILVHFSCKKFSIYSSIAIVTLSIEKFLMFFHAK